MYRFECLHLKCLSEPILSKYCEVLSKFSNEIDKIQKVELGCLPTINLPLIFKLYLEQQSNPPIGYNMPPHSGKALWAHQLLKHMEQPMNLIKVHQSLLKTAHGKNVVKKYNKMAITLTEYEILRYRNWIKIVESTCSNLQVCKFDLGEKSSNYWESRSPC